MAKKTKVALEKQRMTLEELFSSLEKKYKKARKE